MVPFFGNNYMKGYYINTSSTFNQGKWVLYNYSSHMFCLAKNVKISLLVILEIIFGSNLIC